MAHVEDRWFRDGPAGPDGKPAKVKLPRHGKGLRYRVRYEDPSGAERSKSFRLKTDAEHFRDTTAADVKRGTWLDPEAGKITLKRYGDDWLAMQTFDPSTREAVEMRLRRHIYPVLGNVPLGQLASRPSLVQSWVRGLEVSASYGRVCFSTLSGVLNDAVANELIPKNPCQSRAVHAPKPVPRKIVSWEASRVTGVQVALPERYQLLADLGSGLGMRQGEIFGLSVGDIDFLRRKVHIRRQVKLVGGKQVFGPPKGGKEREVPLPDSIGLAISSHLERFPVRSVTLPWREPGGEPVTAQLIMTSPTGLAINRNSFNRGPWKDALEAAGVPQTRENGCHALRHHFASVLLAGGVDIRALSEYLGHTDPGFTLRVYTHLMPSADIRMRDAIEAARLNADGPATAQNATQ